MEIPRYPPLDAEAAWDAVTSLDDGSSTTLDLALEPGEEGTLRLPGGEERFAVVEEVAPASGWRSGGGRPMARDARRADPRPRRRRRDARRVVESGYAGQPVCGSPWAGGAELRPAGAQRGGGDRVADFPDRPRPRRSAALDWEPALARLRSSARSRRGVGVPEPRRRPRAGGLRRARRSDAPRRPARGRPRRGHHRHRARRTPADQPPSRREASRAARGAQLVDGHRAGRETRFDATPGPLADAIGWMTAVGAQWDTRLAALRDAVRAEPRRASQPLDRTCSQRPLGRCAACARSSPASSWSSPARPWRWSWSGGDDEACEAVAEPVATRPADDRVRLCRAHLRAGRRGQRAARAHRPVGVGDGSPVWSPDGRASRSCTA